MTHRTISGIKPGPLSLLAAALLAISCFTSCKVYQPTYYFKNITRDTIITGFQSAVTELKIQKNDVLAIGITSLSAEQDKLFNTPTTETMKGIQVDQDGYIYLHQLGKTKVEGLTRRELKLQLEKALLPYLKDPVVNVNYTNHRVTVLGDTKSQVVEMPEEKIALLEVLAVANPLTENSELHNVMVIRELEGAKQFKLLNLEDPSIFTSPWYYLQPNDLVVVKPNTAKVVDQQNLMRRQMLYSIILSGVSFLVLIIDRITR